jgi:hypothetical protein
MNGPTGQSFERACTMTVALLGAAALCMPVETMGQQRNSGVARPLFPGVPTHSTASGSSTQATQVSVGDPIPHAPCPGPGAGPLGRRRRPLQRAARLERHRDRGVAARPAAGAGTAHLHLRRPGDEAAGPQPAPAARSANGRHAGLRRWRADGLAAQHVQRHAGAGAHGRRPGQLRAGRHRRGGRPVAAGDHAAGLCRRTAGPGQPHARHDGPGPDSARRHGAGSRMASADGAGV